MPSQHEHDPSNAKRKRTESNAGEKEGQKSAQQKQIDEFFYQPLQEYSTINIATVEASDLLRTFRQWPDHIQLSVPVHVITAIHNLNMSHDAEIVELVGRYWQAGFITSVREMRIDNVLEPLSSTSLSKAQTRGDNTKLSMLRTSRAIRTWAMLKHDAAALMGEPRMELERALAKHLLDCCLLFLLKWQIVLDRPRIPGLKQILNETIVFLLETTSGLSSAQDDTASQLETVSSQRTAFPASSSQQTALRSSQQKGPSEGSNATKAKIPADTSVEAPKSDLELVKPMLVHSEHKPRELALYSGQALAMEQVRYVVELTQYLPPYITDLVKLDGILFHGPPGTGKTSIARMLASRPGVTTFKADPSSIMSRYVGDGEKIIRALFAVAALKAPSVIILDEIDGLLMDRNSEQDGASYKIKAQFMSEWSKCQEAGSDVLIVGTTSRPWTLDKAIISRFSEVIYIPLPNAEDVKSILQLSMKYRYHGLKDGDFDALAGLAYGSSVRSLNRVGTRVFWYAQKKAIDATFFHVEKVDNRNVWVPCSANDPNAKRCNYTSFDDKDQVLHSKITMADVKAVLLKSNDRPDNSDLMIKEHEEFNSRQMKGN